MRMAGFPQATGAMKQPKKKRDEEQKAIGQSVATSKRGGGPTRNE